MFLGWIMYGIVTLSPNSVVDNCAPNACGLVDEITSFPYTVPAGYELVIDSMGIEGPALDTSNNHSQTGFFVWLGDFPCTNAKALMSCTTTGGSTQLVDMGMRIPAGKKVNIRVMNNTTQSWVNGWYLKGSLNAIP